ncbi:SubName: Full=Related to pyrazinamidase/nicotinamidase {ECO:0000313/EMBL:CCA69090.1} [Serendipita indica DSM 11827]|nr:SubName: Full=Related to pyrazinamidase/nicotinamidase {ECO:0000313/EMBL:CCA69090.1} [Serendipita indica DSM 11827]
MKPKTALILVDIQYDFLPPDGSLAVNEGNQILEPTYKLLDNAREYFDLVVASQTLNSPYQDHPVSHVSFASTHGKDPFTAIEVPKLHSEETITQMLWPDHCVQGTFGFKTIVLVDAVRAVDGSQNEAVLAELQRWGCEMASSNNLINV